MSDDNAPSNSLPAKAPFTPWHRGMSTPNPAGRGKGVPNKFSKAFLHDVSKKWAQHGEDVLEQVRRDDPGLFLRVCAGLIPKELLVITHSTTPVQQLSETELQAILVEDVTAGCAFQFPRPPSHILCVDNSKLVSEFEIPLMSRMRCRA